MNHNKIKKRKFRLFSDPSFAVQYTILTFFFSCSGIFFSILSYAALTRSELLQATWLIMLAVLSPSSWTFAAAGYISHYFTLVSISDFGIECSCLGIKLKHLSWNEISCVEICKVVHGTVGGPVTKNYFVFSGHTLSQEEKDKIIFLQAQEMTSQ